MRKLSKDYATVFLQAASCKHSNTFSDFWKAYAAVFLAEKHTSVGKGTWLMRKYGGAAREDNILVYRTL